MEKKVVIKINRIDGRRVVKRNFLSEFMAGWSLRQILFIIALISLVILALLPFYMLNVNPYEEKQDETQLYRPDRENVELEEMLQIQHDRKTIKPDQVAKVPELTVNYERPENETKFVEKNLKKEETVTEVTSTSQSVSDGDNKEPSELNSDEATRLLDKNEVMGKDRKEPPDNPIDKINISSKNTSEPEVTIQVHQDKKKPTPISDIKTTVDAMQNAPANYAIKPVENVEKNEQAGERDSVIDEEKLVNDSKTSSMASSHAKIGRALLTSGIKNIEPLDNITSPISVSEHTKTKIYYFTELFNMKGKALYHYWLWKDKIVSKRKIVILGDRWRASTSKKLPNTQVGEWTARIVDDQSNILNEIKFEVIKE
jgi:hypothetical protein